MPRREPTVDEKVARALVDAEYRRRIDARNAELTALKEAVFEQGRRELPAVQERALASRNSRVVIGFRNLPRGAA